MAEKLTQHSRLEIVPMNIKIEREFKQQIKECAKAENKSVTAWLRVVAKREHAKLKRRRAQED